MYAIAFDLHVASTEAAHPRGVSAAYDDIQKTLKQFGFEWRQGSLYVTMDEDMAKLFAALNALKALSWFPDAVRDIRAFRVEQWSDFTSFMKPPPAAP